MAIQLQGNSGTVGEVDSSRRPVRVALEPNGGSEVVGHYVVGGYTGIIATPAAGAEFFQLRNSHASNLVVIEKIMCAMVNAAAVTAAQEFGWDVGLFNTWSGQGTGGSAVTPTKRRQSMSASSLPAGDVRNATTSALGGGTKSFISTIGGGPGPQTNAIGASGNPMFLPEDDLRYPIAILANNEGIALRNVVAYATGSMRAHLRIMWREVTSY